MQMIESSVTERGMLPLPSAALVIDIRGVRDDNVLDWLTIEIADLASEMKTYNVHHWRLLTNFISLRRLAPTKDNAGPDIEKEDEEEEEDELQGPMGRIQTTKSRSILFYGDQQQSAAANNSNSSMPFDLLEKEVADLVDEITRIRNNRIAAVNDSNHTGIPGQSIQDATVRIIFLADAKSMESLTSAALYADALKEHYRKLNRRGTREFINTTVLCLGNEGFSGPPTRLIHGLMRNNSWAHLDSLILSEEYRDDAAWIAGTMQAYLAELLLYVLLIVPPFNVPTSESTEGSDNKQNGNHTKEIHLPFHTYVIGLAALEYSARWGRRWLNFGLARETVDILRQKPADSTKEKARISAVADAWFKDWRERVQATIPHRVPGDVPALEGVRRAEDVADRNQHVFTGSLLQWNIGETSITDLENYQDKLEATYSTAGNEPSMEDSVLQSTLQVMHVLQGLESKSVAERQVTELSKLQVEAEQVLSDKRFFQGATGSVPRARTQLWAIGSTISRFQREHQNNDLNQLIGKEGLQKRKEAFKEAGDKMIANFKKHITNLPLLSGALGAKLVLEILSLLLIMVLSALTVLIGLAWLHHVLALNASNFLSVIDGAWLGIPALEMTGLVIVALLLVLELVQVRPVLVNKQRSALWIEIGFWLLLLLFALSGWLITYSLDALSNLARDPFSIQYLTWLSFIPQWAFYAGIVVALLFAIEVGYFFWWLDRLQKERKRIIAELRKQQQADRTDVVNFIADDILLEILLRAELTDGKEGLGAYYFRVDRLCDTLEEVAKKIRLQQQLASNRLLLSQSETQQGTGPASNGNVWLNLHIRDEMLEMEVLTDLYKGLRQSLVTESEEIRELAEFLLRSQGTEKAAEIGQQLEDRPTKNNEEQHRLLLLISAIVTMAMRFAIDPLSVRNIDHVIERYKSMSESTLQETPALNMLVRMLNKKVSQAMLQVQAARNNGVGDSMVATDAIATWGQIFWQHKDKDQRLHQILLQDGVLAQLARIQQDNYDPRAVMRKLLAHTVLFGRSLHSGRGGEVFLLLSPSAQSHEFRQGLKSMRLPRIINFPDGERILLLGIQRFVAEPLLLPEPSVPLPQIATATTNTPQPPVASIQQPSIEDEDIQQPSEASIQSPPIEDEDIQQASVVDMQRVQVVDALAPKSDSLVQ